jgi:hypothetical protein
MSHREDAQQQYKMAEEGTSKQKKTHCGSRARRVGQGPSVRGRCGSCAGLAPSIRGRREGPRPRDRAVMFIPALRFAPVFLLDALCLIWYTPHSQIRSVSIPIDISSVYDVFALRLSHALCRHFPTILRRPNYTAISKTHTDDLKKHHEQVTVTIRFATPYF